ncbi:MAG: hypothetical protein ABWY08_18110 [Comamonas sp.]
MTPRGQTDWPLSCTRGSGRRQLRAIGQRQAIAAKEPVHSPNAAWTGGLGALVRGRRLSHGHDFQPPRHKAALLPGFLSVFTCNVLDSKRDGAGWFDVEDRML